MEPFWARCCGYRVYWADKIPASSELRFQERQMIKKPRTERDYCVTYQKRNKQAAAIGKYQVGGSTI